MSLTRSRRVAFVLAAVLTLSVAGSAAAYDVPDTFSVPATIQITGLPALVDYGSVPNGTTSAVQLNDATVVANASWQVFVTGTDFARSGGGAPVSKGARQLLLSSTGAGVSFEVTPGPAAWQAFDSATLTNGTADASGSAGSFNLRSELRVAVPSGTAAGTYNGTITYTIAGS